MKIEDINNAKLEYWIEIDDLSLSIDKRNFAADVNKILVSIFSAKSFCREKEIFDLDKEKEKEVVILTCLEDNSTEDWEDNSTAQTKTHNNNKIQEVIV